MSSISNTSPMPSEAGVSPPSTQKSRRGKRTGGERFLPIRLLQTPAVALLFLWMIVPLAMTVYFSFNRYNLMSPDQYPHAQRDAIQRRLMIRLQMLGQIRSDSIP